MDVDKERGAGEVFFTYFYDSPQYLMGDNLVNFNVVAWHNSYTLISTIRARQRNWMGHLLRGDSLQREIMEERMEGKRERGRPRQKLLDWMMSEGYGKLKEEAQNR